MIFNSSIFSGVRFFLAGFNPQQHLEVKSKIVSEGGDYLEEYTPDCTHVIVDNIVFDDPICVAARRDGKALVTSLWIGHSFDSGGPADHNLTLYRPPKGLNGIPGASELLISLTGFHGQERDDIRAMAHQMGAQFSKAMVAHKVTHLVCYKFEGEKYILAKRIGSTKIVNSYWLEDCLKAWTLLPEENYGKSTYEVDIEAEVKDSEDEAEGVTGRRNSGITNQQPKIGESHNHSGLQSKVSIPPTQQGFSNNSSINAERLTESVSAIKLDKQSDMMTESINANKQDRQSDMLAETITADTPDKQPSKDYRDLGQMDTKTGNFDLQNAQSNHIENGLPSTSGSAKSSSDFSAKPSLDYSKTTMKTSPLSLRKSPPLKTSLKPSEKYGKSDGIPREAVAEKLVDEVPTFNLETDTEEAASEGIGGSSIGRQANSSAGKRSPLNSKESPRRFSLSLQSTGELTCQNLEEERRLPEQVIADACTFNTGLDQGKAAFASGASSAEIGVDMKEPGGILPQKRTAVSNVSHSTPKSQKLASSASKRVDAEEPETRDNPLKKRKSGAKSGSRIGDQSTGPSPYLSSAKSNANNAAPSRSVPFDVLQGSKPADMDPLTNPNTNNGFPSLGDDNNQVQLQNMHKKGADSFGINDLESEKSGSLKLNSGDLNGNSISKQPRKKMVARKTLGSRPKSSNTKADDQGSSISRSSDPDDIAINLVVQENRVELAASSVADKDLSSHTVDEPGCLGAKPQLNSTTKINHTTDLLVDETDAQPKSDIRNEKPQRVEQLHLAKSQSGEASGELFCQTNEAKVTTLASKKTYKQETPVAETAVKEQNLVTQKKGRGVKANKKNLVAAKEAAKDADKGDGGKNSNDTVKEPVVSPAVKKGRGTVLLNKSKRSVEVENENELLCNDRVEVGKDGEPVSKDQHAKKGLKCLEKLALNKNHGTPLVNKSEGPVEVENGPVFDGDKGQSHGRKSSEEPVASSNTTLGDEEGKNESKNDLSDGNDQVTSKAAKCPQKLAGKKRRGTVLLNKSDGLDDVEKENELVIRGEGKLADESSNLDRPVGDDKENGPLLGKGTIKGGKRAGNLTGKKRRGTLVLNTTEAPVDEGKQTKSDEDQSKSGMLTEKLTSESNLSANKSDVSDSKIFNTNELKEVRKRSACFILSGHRLQRKEFQKLIKRLKGKVCRDSHQWSYQASHFIVPDPIRRTEKFFAAAASGSWILKTDYLIASSQAGKFLAEEPYEWHKSGLNEDGAIGLEAPRKWRLLRERTGHGAFYGMRIVIYGECIAPPLETLKRAVNAGDGTILATSPPYTRFLESGIDYAVISPGMPRVDVWVQEFLRHQIPCVLADYLVEYVCKPGYSLDRHVQYNTHEWAAKSFSKLLSLSEEVVVDAVTTTDDQVIDDLACQVCGSTDRGDVMLICGNETGSIGCGIGIHIDCCDPPLEDIPEEDWFCPKCSKPVKKLPGSSKKKQHSQRI